MARKTRVMGAIAALGAVILTAACGNGISKDSTSDSGSLTYAYAVEATTLDPIGMSNYSNSASNGARAFAIYDALFVLNPNTGALVPRLATSITPSDDGAAQTLKLRKGVEFSDGTPFDAAAVKFNWERLADSANHAAAGAYAQMISDMKVVNGRTLQFRVKPATTQFGQIIANYLAAVGSPTAIKKEGKSFGQHPIGAGPFIVDKWVQDSKIHLVRNDNYWQSGKPHVRELTMLYVPDPQQTLQALQTGEVDIAEALASPQLLLQAKNAGLSTHEWSSTGGRWMDMNTDRAPFNNPLAVRAMRTAVDRSAYAKAAEGPTGTPQSTFFRSGTPYFDPAGTFPDYDPKATQRALDAYAAQTGHPLTFTILGADAAKSSTEALQTVLSAYKNLKVGVQIVESTDYLTRTAAGNFQMGIFGPRYTSPFPELQQSFETGSPRNFSHVSNSDLDAALHAAALATTESERRSDYERIQKIVVTQLPIVTLLESTSGVAYQKNVRNLRFFTDLVPDWPDITISQ